MRTRRTLTSLCCVLCLLPGISLAQLPEEDGPASPDDDTGAPIRTEGEASRDEAKAAAEAERDEVREARDEAEKAARESGVYLADEETGGSKGPPAPTSPGGAVGGLTWNASVDLPLLLGTGAIFGASYLGAHRQPLIEDDTYVGGEPGGIDSLAVLELKEGPKKASDLVLYGGLALGLGFNLWDGLDGAEPAAQTVVYVEALTITGAITEMAKWAWRRPRPYVHGARTRGETIEAEFDTDLSFFSGHSSFAATIGFATARSVDLTRDLGTGAKVALYGGATVFAVGVASLRVMAGKHWPSDVLTGLLVGGSVGWLVPTLHHVLPEGVAIAPTGDGGAVVAYGGRW